MSVPLHKLEKARKITSVTSKIGTVFKWLGIVAAVGFVVFMLATLIVLCFEASVGFGIGALVFLVLAVSGLITTIYHGYASEVMRNADIYGVRDE